MLEFIQLLEQRYRTVLGQLDKNHTPYFEYQQRIDQLIYAESLLRKGQLLSEQTQLPLQIAVIGPTQVGKSSLVNALLQQNLAKASPLAGFTVYPQAFAHGLPTNGSSLIQRFFGRFEALSAGQQPHSRFDCYAWTQVATDSPFLPQCVLWDTPDFDSIDARDYREGVIRTLTLADVLILVVSKEKYADQAVWDVMRTLAPLKQPTLLVLNKLDAGQGELILPSLLDKWRQIREDTLPTVVNLAYQKTAEGLQWPQQHSGLISDIARHVQREHQIDAQQRFLQQYWRGWMQPVIAEHQALHDWQAMVDQVLLQAVKLYRRDYLDHPQHYQTFQEALVSLLSLLEVPGIAWILSKTRRVMTWPFRTLFKRNGSTNKQSHQELAVLQQLGEHVCIQLADVLLTRMDTSIEARWWRDTAQALRRDKSLLLSQYQQSVSAYHQSFQSQVQSAAQRLYERLQEQPLMLNSLRAMRISTDVGAVLLSIQAGGIGMHDLIIAPLALTVSSLMAEGAMGSYMQRVEAELRQQQLQTVEQQVFDAGLRRQLYALAQIEHLPQRFNISEAQYRGAEQALAEKKHGLRFI